MKKRCSLLLLFCLLLIRVFSQGTIEERKGLHDLLEARRGKFEAYSYSLEKKSGFFGNKTKKDIQHSIDVLSEIVETDNRIISSLNHVIDFRNYEKVNVTYDKWQNESLLKNLQQATDTLTRQVDALSIANAALKSKSRRLNWLVYVLSFAILGMILFRRRKKTENT